MDERGWATDKGESVITKLGCANNVRPEVSRLIDRIIKNNWDVLKRLSDS